MAPTNEACRTAGEVPGGEGATFQFWSPDTRKIAFCGRGKRWRADVDGGPGRAGPVPRGRGGSWSQHAVILINAFNDGAHPARGRPCWSAYVSDSIGLPDNTTPLFLAVWCATACFCDLG